MFFLLFHRTKSRSFHDNPYRQRDEEFKALCNWVGALNSAFVIFISFAVLLRVEYSIAAELTRTRKRFNTLESLRKKLSVEGSESGGREIDKAAFFVLEGIEKRFGSYHPEDWNN